MNLIPTANFIRDIGKLIRRTSRRRTDRTSAVRQSVGDREAASFKAAHGGVCVVLGRADSRLVGEMRKRKNELDWMFHVAGVLGLDHFR